MSPSEIEKLRNKIFGFVFQQFFLNSTDTALNNVLLPLKIGKVSPKERKKRAQDAINDVELSDKINVKTMNLSGGQKQRVCIARAIVNQPDIIFADEPTGNLDSQTGKNVEDLLFKLNKDQGITLIIVTHDEDIASRCDRQVFIKDGKLINESRK
jgi:putative ABC transport system ATP-binding protein